MTYVIQTPIWPVYCLNWQVCLREVRKLIAGGTDPRRLKVFVTWP